MTDITATNTNTADLSVEERLTRLEALVATVVGQEIGEIPAEPEDVEAAFVALQVERWTRVIDQLVAENGWTSEEASQNFINLLNSLEK